MWLAVLAALFLSVDSAPTRSQVPNAQVGSGDGAALLDSLPVYPYGEMRMLFEKTFLKIDVLRLVIRLNAEDAWKIEELAAGRNYSDELAHAIADIAIHSRDAWARIRFERDISLGQFLGGTDDNLRKARDAGIIAEGDYEKISRAMPVWYAFLEERGIKDGDVMLYRVRDDSLHTQYWGVDGDLLLDQIDVGPERRLALLGSYFVRGSDFRERLIKSLFERREPAAR